ncbi:TetR family transcriptional regulator [Kocuria sp. LUK]|uniref:TetR family transcriptional regulator n=1 Tax=Kocuria TaxID=57493 RepID=UPI001E5D1C7E|nr:TetR family transcriptional regulator [Kocuria sp. LUK]MCD1144450.1 TetR family transcriptional regulator [Kocuria sp. LUK]
MFRPEAPSEHIERHVEAVIEELVAELDHWSRTDPVPEGADDRAYVQAFSDARENSDRDQVTLLHAAVARPHLAEALIQLNRRMDREDLDPGHPAGVIGVIVRLAMDGLWVSDILDATRFDEAQRRRIIGILTGLTHLTDERLEGLLAEVVPGEQPD